MLEVADIILLLSLLINRKCRKWREDRFVVIVWLVVIYSCGDNTSTMASHGYGLDYHGDLEYKEDNDVSPPTSVAKATVKAEVGKKDADTLLKEDIKEFEAAIGTPWYTIRSPGSKKRVEDNREKQEKKKVDAMNKKKKHEAKKRMDALVAKKQKTAKECNYCHNYPCCLGIHYDDLMEIGAAMEEDHSNKEIRHALYREMATRLWGRIGKGNRRELPKCVVAEIHDAYPTKKGEAYVGFQPYGSFKAVTMMEESDEHDEN
jgi:hypothetical protein